MSYQKQHSKLTKINFLGILVLTFAIVSCNNQGTESTSSKDSPSKDAAPQQSLPTNKVFMGDGQFAYMALPKTQLDEIFRPGEEGRGAKKIVFRFGHSGTAGSNIIIQGFPTRNDNVHYPSRVPINLVAAYVTNPPVDLSNREIYFSDLEMNKSQYQRLRATAPADGFLIFTPFAITDGDYIHCVSYWMRWATSTTTFAEVTQKLDADNQLNPSPPADPGD